MSPVGDYQRAEKFNASPSDMICTIRRRALFWFPSEKARRKRSQDHFASSKRRCPLDKGIGCTKVQCRSESCLLIDIRCAPMGNWITTLRTGMGRSETRALPGFTLSWNADRTSNSALFQLLLNRRRHFFRIWRHRWLKSLHHFSVAVDQKLGEVPLDVARYPGARLLRQISVERSLVRALSRKSSRTWETSRCICESRRS